MSYANLKSLDHRLASLVDEATGIDSGAVDGEAELRSTIDGVPR